MTLGTFLLELGLVSNLSLNYLCITPPHPFYATKKAPHGNPERLKQESGVV